MHNMFEEMLAPAKRWLSTKDPAQIAASTGAIYENGSLHLPTLGIPVTVTVPEWDVSPQLPGWHHLVLLHYLNLADGTPATRTPVSFSQLKDGLVRGTGFDRRCEQALSQFLAGKTEKEVLSRCLALGGKVVPGRGDVTVELPVFPRYPVTLSIYFADEEFPATGRMMVDSSADHYLTIEDAVTVGEIILDYLENPPKAAT